MGETILLIGGALGIIISTITIMCFMFYSKSQVDKKIQEAIKDATTPIKESIRVLTENIDEDVKQINEDVAEYKLLNQQARSQVKDELHEKLDSTKLALEEAMKQFINTLTDIKQADKDMAVQFITLVNGVKDELKNDYTARYNDLLVIINTKANEADFTRFEQKFDKITETIIELKTIVQHELNKD